MIAPAESLYDDFLRAIMDGRDFFQPPPRRERLGRVSAEEDPIAFAVAVSPIWNGSKQVRGFGYTVILESRQRRSRGLQNEPVAIEIQTRDDYLALLGKESEVQAFRDDFNYIIKRFPSALAVLRARPKLIISNHGAWLGITEIVDYLLMHPCPGCFVRALPVAIHTKFIETHEVAIEALLSALPESGYDPHGSTFENRCGFKQDESSIRGRFLCARLQSALNFPVTDIELRISTWAALTIPSGTRIIACENKTNFLALPAMENTLALWGAGGAATGLFPKIPWFAKVPFVYWLNDDVDRLGVIEANVADDLNPADYSGNLDWNQNHIQGTRDLEDFARLWLNIGALQSDVSSGNIFIGLKWVDYSGNIGNTTTPAIKLYPAYGTGDASYLTRPAHR